MAAYPNLNINHNQYNMKMNFHPFNAQTIQSVSSKDMKNQSTLNTSKRNNMSSKSMAKGNKSYQVSVNEDISLIERTEAVLNQILMNHSKVCPYCSKGTKYFLFSV